jgi:hypothetical protein
MITRRINKNSMLRIVSMTIPLLLFLFLNTNAQYNVNIIKAAYIERITRFVEWPAKDGNFADDRFIIGVYGETGFYKTLAEVFKEKPVKDHKVIVIVIKNPEEINTCNLCYISEKANPLISKFVDKANSSGVLLISGTADFSKEGVHINFYIEDEKLKFEINKKSMDFAGFKVSYLLMQNTRIIQ